MLARVLVVDLDFGGTKEFVEGLVVICSGLSRIVASQYTDCRGIPTGIFLLNGCRLRLGFHHRRCGSGHGGRM
jgi:hypothetical protein